MKRGPKAELHLTCCDCPHVNIVIAVGGVPVGHFAAGADEAENIGNEILRLAAEARAKTAGRLHIGHA